MQRVQSSPKDCNHLAAPPMSKQHPFLTLAAATGSSQTSQPAAAKGEYSIFETAMQATSQPTTPHGHAHQSPQSAGTSC
jgi:hypothetical protein